MPPILRGAVYYNAVEECTQLLMPPCLKTELQEMKIETVQTEVVGDCLNVEFIYLSFDDTKRMQALVDTSGVMLRI
jgi:hypothetical protein